MARPPHTAVPPVPIVNAMLIADLAIREEGTHKVSLIGIFENLRASRFPFRHPTMALYVKMTDAQGEYDMRIELLRLDDATRVVEARTDFHVLDRMKAAELVFVLNNLAFPEPGHYEFRLAANGRHVGSKSFVVELHPSGA